MIQNSKALSENASCALFLRHPALCQRQSVCSVSCDPLRGILCKYRSAHSTFFFSYTCELVVCKQGLLQMLFFVLLFPPKKIN